MKINKRYRRIIKMTAKYINEKCIYLPFPMKHKIFKIIIQIIHAFTI